MPNNPHRALPIFLVFAIGYFLSSFVRGVTATLAPAFTVEFGLTAGQLGLLGGAYFLGFAVLQLPLGNWLDHYGPKRVLLTCLSAAVASSLALCLASGFSMMLLARWIGGIGVSACLIAPLTGARLWLDSKRQQAANSWMLMAGSVGLVAATVPAQWLLQSVGWRMIFLGLAVCFALTMAVTGWLVPGVDASRTRAPLSLLQSYRPILTHPYFRRIAPLGFVNYGILVGLQTLWVGPWLTDVAGQSTEQAATGLFAINATMLFVFWAWGILNPRLHGRGISADRIMAWGTPLGIAALGTFAWLGPQAGWISFTVYCTLSSVLSLTHPAVGAAFPLALAGRAISAFNLVLFLGIFVAQWAIGACLDMLKSAQWPVVHAYQVVFGSLALCSACGYGWFQCLAGAGGHLGVGTDGSQELDDVPRASEGVK